MEDCQWDTHLGLHPPLTRGLHFCHIFMEKETRYFVAVLLREVKKKIQHENKDFLKILKGICFAKIDFAH